MRYMSNMAVPSFKASINSNRLIKKPEDHTISTQCLLMRKRACVISTYKLCHKVDFDYLGSYTFILMYF